MKMFLFALLTVSALFIGFKANAQEKKMVNKNAKALVVYFSRTGEQYSVGNITKGNTAFVAEEIAAQTGADLFEIKLKNDAYPAAYKALTEVALTEKKQNARPEIAGGVANFADYETVFVGTPNWWADMPMAVYTFLESHDFKGKTVAVFVTHEGSGYSSIPSKVQTTTGADITEALAVAGHTAQNDRAETKKQVSDWLKKIGF